MFVVPVCPYFGVNHTVVMITQILAATCSNNRTVSIHGSLKYHNKGRTSLELLRQVNAAHRIARS